MSGGSKALANRILRGLLIGAVAGIVVLLVGTREPVVLDYARRLSVWILDPLGQIFLRMLFFVVIPLVFVLLAGAVPGLTKHACLGARKLPTGGRLARPVGVGGGVGELKAGGCGVRGEGGRGGAGLPRRRAN